MPDTTRARYGIHDHTIVLALAGAVRYPSARPLRRLVDDVLHRPDVDEIVVDLRETTFVDSTGLGILARIARQMLELKHHRALLVCPRNDIAIVLRSSSFDTLCDMVEEPPFDVSLPEELRLVDEPYDGDALGPIILDAHRDLAELGDTNRNEYAAVIAALEAELRGG